MSRKNRSTAKARSAPSPSPRRIYEPDWPVVVLGLVGLCITGYLSFAGLFASAPIGCSEGSGCDVIQNSRWSILFGLPVALWGFGLYLIITLIAGLGRPRLKRWQRLWLLSLFGVVFSLYLTAAGWFGVQAFCAWCLSSLLTLLVLLLVLTFRRPESAPGMGWAGFLGGQGAIIAVLILGLHAVYAGWLAPPEDPRLRALAEHLDETGARYYGASWCPTCQEQTRLFGPAAEHLPYVECSPQGRGGPVAFECVANDIASYPTWVIGERRFTSLQSPEQLARYSRFDWAGFEVED